MSDKPSINPIDILTRLDWTECEELELKAAKGGLPKNRLINFGDEVIKVFRV